MNPTQGLPFGRAILGDNQFLGVNHASPAKAAALGQQFARTEAILEVIGWAYEAGIRDFMFTTHERLGPVLAEIERSRLFPGMRYIPCLPYAHKYANTLSEGGLKAVFTEHLRGCSKRAIAAGAARVASGNFAALIDLLLEVELGMMRSLPVAGVFLQNVMFDLLLGLRANRMIERFHHRVQQRFAATPGYITMNHGLAQQVLCDDIGIAQPWLCANFNAAGFRMHPQPEAVRASHANGRSRNIAMSVLASGALDPRSALDHVLAAPGVDCVLFGSSRRENIVGNAARILGRPT
jgi:hypothetical protein